MARDTWSDMLECLRTWEARRKNAAKCQWSRLPPKFRLSVLQYVQAVMQEPEEVRSSCPTVQMRSPFGEFELSSNLISRLIEIVPHLT